jgi:hypothetical protein
MLGAPSLNFTSLNKVNIDFSLEEIMKQVMVLALSFVLAVGAMAAPAPQDAAPTATPTGTKSGKKKRTATVNAVTKRLDEMQQAIGAQQQQIQQLMQEIQSRDAAIQQLQQQNTQAQSAAAQAQQRADAVASQASQQQQDVAAVKNDVTDLKSNFTNTAVTLQETQKHINEMESPLAIHYKGITLTPGGFLAAESVWRQHALGSDINTPFNSIPMPGSSLDQISEFFGSGRQSRISMLAEGKLSGAKLTGYMEADFLSAGVTSNNNQSNSYTLRQRQMWGQAALNNGWSFTGGQMWSLVTETKKGVDNRSEALPMTIDPQYHVGFSWARQYGFRVSKNFSNKFWLAFSAENPQTTFTAHGDTDNFIVGSAGTSGGLYNPSATYSFNYMPDFVVKAAFEPGWGHYEVFGVISNFRDRVFPNDSGSTPSASGAFNDVRTGGGVGANIRGSLANKHVDLGLHFLGGDGIGRYGTSGLPDATIRPNGTLALLRSYQGLGTLEFHYPKADIYFNVGAEYVGRDVSANGSGALVGYGSPTANNSGCNTETLPPATATSGAFPVSSVGFLPGSLGSCTGDTRSVVEDTAGFWFRLYKGPKGTLQFGPQYSYLTRNTWSGASGFNESGTENMVLTSFRYYLP